MRSQLIAGSGSARTIVLVVDDGDEAFSAISAFARREQISGASLTAIGAFARARVGWFDFGLKSYRPIRIDEQCEVLTAAGDVAVADDGGPTIHVHVVLGLRDGTTRGGHLMEGIVRPTLEVIVVESPVYLRRRRRADLGLALIDLPAAPQAEP
jgi:predicted DNA-binding protein with PD1-like motif